MSVYVCACVHANLYYMSLYNLFIVFISLSHSKDKMIFCVFIFNVKQIDFTCSEMCCMNKIAFGVTIKIHLSDLEETLENEQIKSWQSLLS